MFKGLGIFGETIFEKESKKAEPKILLLKETATNPLEKEEDFLKGIPLKKSEASFSDKEIIFLEICFSKKRRE